MTDEIVCPSCRTDDHLSGQPHGDLIHISCAACELEWDRDPSPRCKACGSAEVRPVPQSFVEKSRGTQLSIVAMRVVYLCTTCDAELLRRQLQTNSPLAPHENPAADLR
jgi:hypothetical protein